MVKEQSVRDAVKVLRDVYIDKDLAEKAASEIEKFLDSDVGQTRLRCEDLGAFIFELNAILLSITHDLHLAFNLLPSGQGYGGSGFIRVSPHYVQISKLDPIDSEWAREQYIKMIAQLQDPVVFDLRGCSGGSADGLYFMLCPFFPDGTALFDLHSRLSSTKTFKVSSTVNVYSTNNKIGKYNGRIKVLVSGYTYSGGEIFAKTLQTHGRAKVYGTPTNGAFHATQHLRFDDIMLHVPFMKLIDSVTKKDYENVGVVPDFGPTTTEYIQTIFADVADNMFNSADKTK